MKSKILSVIERYQMLRPNATVIVALSGGADSMTLLHFLNTVKKDYNLKLIAAHVNHGLRGDEALRDENFVTDYCQKTGIALKVLHADIKKYAQDSRESIEECGRRIRYEFFESVDPDALIATAHTLSDNMETMLFNLARGTSLKGLCGIPPKRGRIIRPLIEVSRQEIECYCEAHKIPYVIDSTNLQTDYTRNLIRHKVIPQMYSINPAFAAAAQRCIGSLMDDEDYISARALEILEKSKFQDGSFDAKIIAGEHISVRRRIISAVLYDKTNTMPEFRHIDAVDRILTAGGKTQVKVGTMVRVRAGRLEFPKPESDILPWQVKVQEEITKIPFGEVKITLFNKKNKDYTQKINKEVLDNCLDYDKIKNNYYLRSRAQGDVFKQKGRNVTKTLKKLFNEYHIPPEKRNETVILSDSEGILWVEGLGVCERAAVTENTEKIMVISIRRTL